MLYFSLGSRGPLTSFPPAPVIPAHLTSFPRTREPRATKTTVPQCPSATPVRYRGSGVLCFTLDSRVRGNDGTRAGNDGTRAGNDVAHAGKTYEVREPRYAPHVIPADAGIQRKTKHADPLTSPSRHSRTPNVIPATPNVIPASPRHSRAPNVIPADAGTQGHKNNRLPRAPRPPRSASAEAACFAFPWIPASAGMTERVRGMTVCVRGMT